MTADTTLLQMRYTDIIKTYAEQEHISLRQAMDIFYRSRLFTQVRRGISDLHCMDERYLAESLRQEVGKPETGSEALDICEEALDFGTFCIQALAEHLGIADEAAYILLTEKTNLLDIYILKHWEVLHTQGKEYIVEDLMTVLRKKGGE